MKHLIFSLLCVSALFPPLVQASIEISEKDGTIKMADDNNGDLSRDLIDHFTMVALMKIARAVKDGKSMPESIVIGTQWMRSRELTKKEEKQLIALLTVS